MSATAPTAEPSSSAVPMADTSAATELQPAVPSLNSEAPAAPAEPNVATTSAAAAATSSQQPGPSDQKPSNKGQGAAPRNRKHPRPEDIEPIADVMFRRLHKIKEGDNVLLRMPSDQIKAVVASSTGLIHLGKFGAFPSSHLLGLHYDITYEIIPDPTSTGSSGSGGQESEQAQRGFGQGQSKKNKKQKKGGLGNVDAEAGPSGAFKSHPGWGYTVRPLKRQAVGDAIIDDITETNEFIDDSEAVRQALLTQEEIAEMRDRGASAEDIMQAQLKRHEQFELKTEFSKEKWRKRKEKKYLQTIQPLSPSAYNIANHNFLRAPQSILNLREDTLSQLLSLSNLRPGGRYLIVDDTGGLVTAAAMERIGCTGRIMTFTDADSPPAWGVLNTMNFTERELGCVKWLSWLQAEEDYVPQPLPDESDLPTISSTKTQARQRRHMFQVAELNATRDELHRGGWDGLILATDLNPLSVLARLSQYMGGSSSIIVYSPHLQVLAETLLHMKLSPTYLNPTLTESWSRTYQVLPGRTHPLMSTSATGGYLLHAIGVVASSNDQRVYHHERRLQAEAAKKKRREKAAAAAAAAATGTGTATGETSGEANEADQEDVSAEDEGAFQGDADMSTDADADADAALAKRTSTRAGTADEDVESLL